MASVLVGWITSSFTTTSPTLTCIDSTFPIAYTEIAEASVPCELVSVTICLCSDPDVSSHCPSACDSCAEYGCVDSTATFFSPAGSAVTCDMFSFLEPEEVESYCEIDIIRDTCRGTCGVCD